MIGLEKTVVEYPTLFFGLPETTSNLNTFISEHRSTDVNEILLPDTVVLLEDAQEGEHDDLVREPQRKKLRGMEEDCSTLPVSSLLEKGQKWTPGSYSVAIFFAAISTYIEFYLMTYIEFVFLFSVSI